MLRTDCALQLILQHIIHLIQDLFFLGSHLFLLLLVEKYMGLCINKEQGFSQLAEVCVCRGRKSYCKSPHIKWTGYLLYTQICNLSPLCSLSSIENIPTHYRELGRKNSSHYQNSLQPKGTTSWSIFSESFSTCSWQEFGFNQLFFWMPDIKSKTPNRQNTSNVKKRKH